MRNKILFVLSFIGLLAGSTAAYYFSRTNSALPPVFNPVSDPYTSGIYAQGIVESMQSSGENTNVYPEVAGTVRQVLVAEGQKVTKGMPLLVIDDTVQRATAQQQQAAAQAAQAMLEELKAQPRKENLDVAEAQVISAKAAVKNARDQMNKERAAYEIDPRSVSRDAIDTAADALALAEANLEVAQKQRDLLKAGAWTYDIQNQEKQYAALEKSYQASSALLDRYTLRAPSDGVVLSVNTGVGNYVSSQGSYESYSQGMQPALVLSSPQENLQVRCYVDEILVPRLPDPSRMKAQMSIRGTNTKVPLDYVRMQPLISPKIELSDQRQERVDVRVLPVIFEIEKPQSLNLYPGELVDVYIGE